MEAKSPEPSSPVEPQHSCLGHDERCPLCGEDNQCRVAKGHLYKSPCWCHEIVVPNHILSRLAEGRLEPACLCRPCLETISQVSRELEDTEAVLVEVHRVISARRVAVVQNKPDEEDYYLDENGYTVFTAAYHLKRGSCCDNQCRHCPY